MRLAITADLHLDADKPERLEYFERLCAAAVGRGVDYLVCAGDSFDRDARLCAEFEKRVAAAGLRTVVLPGNHDHWLSQRHFAGSGVLAVESPGVLALECETDPAPVIVALPYRENRSAGADLAELFPAGPVDLLLMHGDYGLPDRERSGGERGYYPISGRDLQQFRVRQAVAGHIHQPLPETAGKFCYTGSPWPVTAAECGMRRLLLWDSATGQVQPLPLDKIPWCDRRTVTVVSSGDDRAALAAGLQRCGVRLNGPGGCGTLELRVQGAVRDKSGCGDLLEELLQKSGYSSLRLDLEGLHGGISGAGAGALEFAADFLDRLDTASGDGSAIPAGFRDEITAVLLEKIIKSGVV